MTYITPAHVRQRLEYNKETGVFRWKEKKSGQIAGSKQPDGQWFIFLDGEPTPAQWLAYTHVTGKKPIGDIVHLNGDVSDNRYANLRVYTGFEPLPVVKEVVSIPTPVKKSAIKPRPSPKAVKKSSLPQSGCVGVHFLTRTQKWAAHPRDSSKKVIHLGYYTDVRDAIAAVECFRSGRPVPAPVYPKRKSRAKRPKQLIVRSDILTQEQIERVRALYRYDAITGRITRQFASSSRLVGHTDDLKTRMYILWEPIRIRFEVLAWILTYGHNPIGTIRHKDGNMLNNCLDNLYQTSDTLRQSTSLCDEDRKRTNNKSGCVGVQYLNGRWHARINYNKKRFKLGKFENYDEAVNAVKAFRLTLNTTNAQQTATTSLSSYSD